MSGTKNVSNYNVHTAQYIIHVHFLYFTHVHTIDGLLVGERCALGMLHEVSKVIARRLLPGNRRWRHGLVYNVLIHVVVALTLLAATTPAQYITTQTSTSKTSLLYNVINGSSNKISQGWRSVARVRWYHYILICTLILVLVMFGPTLISSSKRSKKLYEASWLSELILHLFKCTTFSTLMQSHTLLSFQLFFFIFSFVFVTTVIYRKTKVNHQTGRYCKNLIG